MIRKVCALAGICCVLASLNGCFDNDQSKDKDTSKASVQMQQNDEKK
ncbi:MULTISPECIES: hypothetical protein [unclassified Pseudomonas]|jgi:hypothetical protein|nr:hypothetical protein [Pseudomonas sp. NFR16]SEI52671.1 hypothetical protein SAMN03159495_0676 [Pseudomonas sp. NFR16]